MASDNGYLLGEFRLWGKDNLNENCVRVPLIVSAPGWMKSPGRTNAICELIDIFPTVCQWCEVDSPSVVQGKSLAPVLKDPLADHRSMAYTIARRNAGLGRSIRTEDWRYTEWPGPGATELLDSTEQTNRISDANLRDVTIELQESLASAARRAQNKLVE